MRTAEEKDPHPMTVGEMIQRLSQMPYEAKVTLHTGGWFSYIHPLDVRKVDDTHIQIVSKPELPPLDMPIDPYSYG